MINIKLGFLLLFVFIGLNKSLSQTFQFKTTGLSIAEKEKSGKFGEWSEMKPVDILVKLDTDKHRIVIYSEVIQLFEIIEYLKEQETATDSMYLFVCKDTFGEDCTLSLITRKNQNNRKQLYIRYDDRILVYNIVNFD